MTTLPPNFVLIRTSFRHTEIAGDGFKVFAFTSLLPKDDDSVHLAKMAFRETRYIPTCPG